jgi:YbgC/YbaW family acyl-CoA thioester hydrolase
VYPADCDARGHVNQAAFVALFERARWEALSQGPGADVFERHEVWPAVRKATIEYYAEARPGQGLRFETTLTQLGRTSFSLHQSARRASDQTLVAEADSVFVCVDASGAPVAVPGEIRAFFGTRPSVRAGAVQHFDVRGVGTAVDIQGDGPAILFIHGFPLDRTMWRSLVAPLTGWRRIAPDLRGMGLSDLPSAGEAGIAAYADDLAALLDVLQVEEAVVCGLSMGGYIALDLARRHKSRVRGLVLANTRAEADAADAKAARDAMIELVEREGVEALVPRLVPRLFAPASLAALPDAVEHVKTMVRGSRPAGLITALRAMRDRPDSTDLLSSIDVPTLVITGRDDQLISPMCSHTMAQAIPGAHFTVIPDAGHLAPLEQPIATSRVVTEFLQALM